MLALAYVMNYSGQTVTIGEFFANLDRYRIRLNPDKCAFGVPSGQLLGYLISAS